MLLVKDYYEEPRVSVPLHSSTVVKEERGDPNYFVLISEWHCCKSILSLHCGRK